MNYPAPHKITEQPFSPMIPTYKLVPENKGEITFHKILTPRFNGLPDFDNVPTQAIDNSKYPHIVVRIRNAFDETLTANLFNPEMRFTGNFGLPVGTVVTLHSEIGVSYFDLLMDMATGQMEIGQIRKTAITDSPLGVTIIQQTIGRQSDRIPLVVEPWQETRSNSVEWYTAWRLNKDSSMEITLPPNSEYEIQLWAIAQHRVPQLPRLEPLRLSAAALAALRDRD